MSKLSLGMAWGQHISEESRACPVSYVKIVLGRKLRQSAMARRVTAETQDDLLWHLSKWLRYIGKEGIIRLQCLFLVLVLVLVLLLLLLLLLLTCTYECLYFCMSVCTYVCVYACELCQNCPGHALRTTHL